MPDIRIEGPDGNTYVFRDGTPRETMRAAMAKQFPKGSYPETPKQRYARQQLKQRADEKNAGRDTASKIASAVSGAERGLKPFAEVFDYINPLTYLPRGSEAKARDARTEKRRATNAAERQQANPNTFAGGKIAGEIVGAIPLTMGGGAAVQTGGRLLTKVSPKLGGVVEKLGRAVTSGGTRVAAPSKTAANEGKIIVGSRKARVATRAAGGAGASTIAAAPTDQDMVDAALAGAAIPVIGHMAKFGLGKTYDAISGRAGPVRAAEILREVIGENAKAIEKALRNAPKNIKANTAEFLASRGLLTPELAATTKIATASSEAAPLLRVALQRAAGQKRMRQVISGGKNQTNAMENIAATKKALQAKTDPMRESSLANADIGRTQILPAEREAARLRAAASAEVDQAVRFLEAADDETMRLYHMDDLGDAFAPSAVNRQREIVAGLEQRGGTVADSSLATGTAARSKEQIAANLRAQGLAPLDVTPIVGQLRRAASDAEFTVPARARVLNEFANNLESRAAKFGGTIDATGLYDIRRNMGIVVSDLLGPTDAKALQTYTAQIIGEAQPLIDNAIEAAGGKGWRQYLDTFSQGMRDIERQRFQKDLSKLAKTNRLQYAEIMAGENPDYVTKKLGPGKFDINVELQGPDLATANKLGRDISATRAVKETGLEDLSADQKLNFGAGATTKVGGMLEPRVPNVATLGARIAGGLPGVYGGGIAAQELGVRMANKASENTMRNLVPALTSPQQAGELLRVRPAEDYINKMLYGSQQAPPLVSARPFNAASLGDNQRALSQRLTPTQTATLNQNNMAQVRQQALVQTGVQNMTPPTLGEQYGFPEFDPETGAPLFDVDFSEGYPVPIYGVSRNSMRR